MKKIFILYLLVGCATVYAQQLKPKPLPPPAPLGNTSSSHYNDNSNVAQSASSLGTAMGESLGTGLGMMLSLGEDWDSFSNRIDLGVGWGVDYGGLGLKLNYQAPAVFGVTAGFGYNTSYGKYPGENKKYLWNAALQMWCTDHWNFEIGVGPRYFKKYDITQLGVSFLTNYQHQIWGRRLGLLGGVGASLCTKIPPGFKSDNSSVRFEWNLGIVVRLFSD